MQFKKNYVKLRDMVKVLEDITDESLARSFAFRELHSFSWYWCVDKESGSYLINFPAGGRDESQFRHYLFHTKGHTFKLSCVCRAEGHVSFQKFPEPLESERHMVQELVKKALLVYGYYGDGKDPIFANYVVDNIRPPSL